MKVITASLDSRNIILIDHFSTHTLSLVPRAGLNPAWLSGSTGSNCTCRRRAIIADRSLYEWHSRHISLVLSYVGHFYKHLKTNPKFGEGTGHFLVKNFKTSCENGQYHFVVQLRASKIMTIHFLNFDHFFARFCPIFGPFLAQIFKMFNFCFIFCLFKMKN